MVMASLKKIGSRFAFEYFLEVWKPKLIDALRHWLARYTADDIRKMVTRGRFPDTSKLDFSPAAEYVQYIEKISLERLVEDFLAPARPDLIEDLQEMGMPAAKWLAKLRLHILDKIKQGAKTETATPKEGIVMANCDACGKSWPVARAEFDKISSCPFCGSGKDEATPESAIDKEPGQA